MFKHAQRKLAFALVLVLLAGPFDRAFASGTGSTSTSSSTSTASPSLTADGPTGTDPEPIEPYVVSVILALLNLA
jgi:ABC-type phosphate transport system substrate-binding protein